MMSEKVKPLSSGSPFHFPAVCLKDPAFPSLLFQSDLTHLLCHPSSPQKQSRKHEQLVHQNILKS